MNGPSLYAEWLKAFASGHDEPFVRQSEEMLSYFFELLNKTKSAYGWRVTDEVAFKAQLESLASPDFNSVNTVYWQDMARSIEAYEVLALWRTGELAKDCLDLVNRKRVLAPALCARALLELACSSLVNTNAMHKIVTDLFAERAYEKGVVLCPELEELVVKAVHGTRLGDPPDHLKQTNVITYIQKIAKHPNGAAVQGVYDYLCDVTHPNVVGNTRFWACVSKVYDDGSVTLKMEKDAEALVAVEIREKILWALGWSGACVRNAFHLGQDAVCQILAQWPHRKPL